MRSGSVHFSPIEDDFVAVGRGSFRRGLRRRRFFVRAVLIVSLGTIVGVALSWLDTDQIRIGYGLIGGAAALVWFAIVIAGTYLLIPRRSRRLFRQQRSANEPLRWSWDDSGITIEGPRGRVTTAWGDYYDWYEDRFAFGFGINERLYHFVPKRSLDATQVADIRAQAKEICRIAA